MLDDPIIIFTNSSKAMVCFSIGYFLFDTCNMISNGTRKWMEIIVHHGFAILVFGLSITYNKFIAYAAFCLIVEINTVFLHGRTLLLLSNESKTSLRFKMITFINFMTFILFRLGVLAWITMNYISISLDIPMLFSIPFCFGLLFIVSIHINKSKEHLGLDFTQYITANIQHQYTNCNVM